MEEWAGPFPLEAPRSLAALRPPMLQATAGPHRAPPTPASILPGPLLSSAADDAPPWTPAHLGAPARSHLEIPEVLTSHGSFFPDTGVGPLPPRCSRLRHSLIHETLT